MNRLAIALLSSVAALAQPAFAQPVAASSATSGETQATVTTQLPRTVSPSHYDVTVTPDAKALTFAGKEVIDINVLAATDTIVLQAADIAFGSVTLASADGKGLGTAKVTLDPAAQTASFVFAKPIAPGHYKLPSPTPARSAPRPTACSRSTTTAADGSASARSTPSSRTPTRAASSRRGTSPSTRRRFALEVDVPKDQMAVSNMPAASSSTPAGGRQAWCASPPAPKMSTYLLFFGLGDFERATNMAGGTEIGVVTQSAAISRRPSSRSMPRPSAARIQRLFRHALSRCRSSTTSPAPGQSQFFGAMENWGAIFYLRIRDCCSIPIASTSATRQGSSSCSRTRWRTNGSAISSRCAGGTISG